MNSAFPRIAKNSLTLRPVGLQRVSRIGSAASIRVVSASVVVEVLAPGHHNRPCPGFGGEVVSGQHLVFQTSWRLMEQKNPAMTALEVAGRDLLRYTQEFGLTPAAELNLGKPPRPDAGDHDPFGA